MAKNTVLDTVTETIAALHNNSACYEFLKNKKLLYHSCWIRWIPVEQQVRTYIKMAIFNKMINRNLIREYSREETGSFIHIYYVLKGDL